MGCGSAAVLHKGKGNTQPKAECRGFCVTPWNARLSSGPCDSLWCSSGGPAPGGSSCSFHPLWGGCSCSQQENTHSHTPAAQPREMGQWRARLHPPVSGTRHWKGTITGCSVWSQKFWLLCAFIYFMGSGLFTVCSHFCLFHLLSLFLHGWDLSHLIAAAEFLCFLLMKERGMWKELAKWNVPFWGVCEASGSSYTIPEPGLVKELVLVSWRLQLLGRAISRCSTSFPPLPSSISSLLLSWLIFLPFFQRALLAEFLVVLIPDLQLLATEVLRWGGWSKSSSCFLILFSKFSFTG